MAFSGSAAAAHNGGDDHLNSGSAFWEGQELDYELNKTVNNPDGTPLGNYSGETVEIRELNDDDEIGSAPVDQFVVDDDGVGTLDTSDLDGEYVLVPGNKTSVAFVFNSGTVDDDTVNNSNAGDAAFSVNEQTLSAEFDDDEVNNQETTDFGIDSNRGSSDIVVSAGGDLDDDELQHIFDDAADTINLTVSEDQEDDFDVDNDTAIVFEGQTDIDIDDELPANFTDIDEGDYEFEFFVSDTNAEDTASISVVEQDVDAAFSEGVYEKAAGDIVEMSLELEDTDEAWIQIGDEDAGYVDVIHVKDEDDDDEVTFEINTRTAGTNENLDEVYYSEEDEVLGSEVHGGTMGTTSYEDEDGNNVDGSGTAFTNYLDELGLGTDVDDQLTRPLQPTEYEIIANSDGTFIVNDDGETEANNEIGSSLLELTPPTIGEITTHVAPEDAADADDNVEDLLESVTAREEIAEDDRLVVQVEATGLYGAMAQANGGNDIFDDGASGDAIYQLNNISGEGITFDVEADDATGNNDPTSLDFQGADAEDIFVIADNENGQFFVIADTSSNGVFGSSLDTDTTFEASLEYETNEDERYEFNDDPTWADGKSAAGGDSYPYFQADSTQESTTSFDYVERSVTFDNVNVDDVLEAENIEESEISGETNVAPGTDSELRVSSTDASSSFRSSGDVNITEDGEISAEFDFSDQEVEDEFETSFQVGGSSVDSIDSMLVEEGSLSEDAPEDDESEDDESEDDESMDDDSASDDSASDDSASDDSASDDGESDDSSSEETPGFGAIVALVAVLGAALLATRRQN